LITLSESIEPLIEDLVGGKKVLQRELKEVRFAIKMPQH
jgi:hypothetical protein